MGIRQAGNRCWRDACSPWFRVWTCALALAVDMPALAQLGGLDGWKHEAWGESGSRLVDVGPGQIAVGDLLIQPDGKLVLAGQCNQHACTIRLRPNGSPDTLYGPGGLGMVKHENLPIWGNVRVRSMPDGKLLLAGYDPDGFIVIARLMPDGSIDESAGNGTGHHLFDFLGTEEPFGTSMLFDVAVLPDGKVLAVGSARLLRHGHSNADMAVARLSADLAGLDKSFGGGDGLSPPGTKIVPFDANGPSNPEENNDEAAAVHVDGNGLILLAGTVNAPAPQRHRAALVRLLPGGAFDQSFGDGGRIVFQSGIAGSHRVKDVVIDGEGRIVVAGQLSGSSDYGDMLAARRLANGQVDNGFGLNGFAFVSFDLTANSPDDGQVVALQSDGKILVGGYAYNALATRLFAMVRLNENGLPDPTFGMFGKSADRYAGSSVPAVSPSDAVDAIAIGNGGLMVAGVARLSTMVHRVGVARLTLDLVFAGSFER